MHVFVAFCDLNSQFNLHSMILIGCLSFECPFTVFFMLPKFTDKISQWSATIFCALLILNFLECNNRGNNVYQYAKDLTVIDTRLSFHNKQMIEKSVPTTKHKSIFVLFNAALVHDNVLVMLQFFLFKCLKVLGTTERIMF